MRHRDNPLDIAFCIALLETSQCHKFHQLMVHKKITFIATPDRVHQSCRNLYPDNFVARHYEFDVNIPTDNDYLLRCAVTFFRENGTKGRVDAFGARSWYEDNDKHGAQENKGKGNIVKKRRASPNTESPQVGANSRVEYTDDFFIAHSIADSVEVYNTIVINSGKGSPTEETLVTSGKKVQLKLFSSNNGRFVYAMTLIKKTRGKRSKRTPTTTMRHIM
jgi:hypothetical protein